MRILAATQQLPKFVGSFIALLFLTSTVLAQASWVNRPAPSFRITNDIAIADGNKYLVVGGNPHNDSITSIFITSDAGLNWNFIIDNVRHMVTDIEMIGANTGLISGWGGLIWKTTDFGVTWDTMNIQGNAASRHYNGFSFADGATAVAVGGNRTNDSIRTIIRTTDAGANWSIVEDGIGTWLQDVDFASSSVGVAVGDSSVILRTTDAGQNWSAVSSPLTNNRQLMSVNFIDANIGFIAGGNATKDSIQTLLKTVDGGQTWSILFDNLGPMLYDVYFHSATNGHAVGDWGHIIESMDTGNTWNPTNIDTSLNNLDGFRVVRFTDDKFGIAAGRAGKFLIYADSTVAREELDYGLTTNESISVFPVPANNDIYLATDFEQSRTLNIRIIDEMGRTVYSQRNQQFLSGKKELKISASDFTSGQYNLIAGDSEVFVHRKIIILK